MRQHVMRFHKNVGWHNYFDNSNWSKTCKGWINFWNLLYVQLHRPQPSAAQASTLSCSGLNPQLHRRCSGLNPQLHWPQPSAALESTLSCSGHEPQLLRPQPAASALHPTPRRGFLTRSSCLRTWFRLYLQQSHNQGEPCKEPGIS
jgi:hypothetical protein